jgi:hypothetical protein
VTFAALLLPGMRAVEGREGDADGSGATPAPAAA